MNSWREDEARKLTDQLLVAVRSQITGRPDACLLQQMLTAIEQLSGLCHGGKEVTAHLRTLHDCAHAMFGPDARTSDSRHVRANALISIGLLRLGLLSSPRGVRADSSG